MNQNLIKKKVLHKICLNCYCEYINDLVDYVTIL